MIKIATAQIDVIPGNIRENWKQIEKEIQRAREKGAHMLVLPEMCLTGYLIGDLWDQNAFLRECEAYNEKIAAASRDITIRSIPSGASLRVNGDYAGQAPVTLSLNRHKPVHVAADKPGFLSTEKTFYPEMTTQGAILWGRNNEKSKDFKTDILTIRLKKADSGAPPLRELPAQW